MKKRLISDMSREASQKRKRAVQKPDIPHSLSPFQIPSKSKKSEETILLGIIV